MVARSFLLAVSSFALVAASSAPTVAQTRAGPIRPQQAYCRTPAALPALGAEVDNQVQQQRPVRPMPRATTRGAVGADGATVEMAAPPPPPPPAPVAPPSSGGDSIVVSGTSVGATASRTADSRAAEGRIMPPGPRPRPQPGPQAGLLTAGEHDDLLNPELYARYVRQSDLAQLVPDLPVLDTGRILRVEVRGANGQAVPFADVRVTCADGNFITLKTQADGAVALFPDLDRLSPSVTIAASQRGRVLGESRRVTLARGDGGQTVTITGRAATRARAQRLDLVLVIDTTGSMGDEIRYLQSELRGIVNDLRQRHQGLDLRVGFVFYRDTGDDYVTRTVPFSADIANQQGVLARQGASGGGDYPEAMDQALNRAIHLDWRPDAVRSLVLVADAPPHDDRFGRTWAAAEVARQQRIQIVPVAASGVADKAEYVMRAMAALTQSRYLFLTDDSGIGNPHAPPAIDCYLVTRLSSALRRVIDSQLSGRRIEPDRQEIIREVGNYDAGHCILPADFDKNA